MTVSFVFFFFFFFFFFSSSSSSPFKPRNDFFDW